MALIKSVRGFTPEIGENCFLADNETIIGDEQIVKNYMVNYHGFVSEQTERNCYGNL